MITDQQKREFAEELIQSHATDVEHLTIAEVLGDSELDTSGLTDDELDKLCIEIHDLIAEAQVTVEWPEPADTTDTSLWQWQAVIEQDDRAFASVAEARAVGDTEHAFTISVVRGTAAPNRADVPCCYENGDIAMAMDAYLDDEDPSVGAEVRYAQAQAMAAGLNAAAGGAS